jgi:RNA polymerase sigma-70 factor (ECF subfamily)
MAIHNNEDAYRELFHLLFPSLFRLSLSMLKSREQAEEIASDVLLRLWQNRKELLEIDNIKVYALTIARNMSLNLLRTNSRIKLISLDNLAIEENEKVLTPHQILVNHQNKELLQDSIQALPTRCKIVFKLIKEEGLSYKEVANVLNISPKTVDAHLVTAMKKLSDVLKLKKV